MYDEDLFFFKSLKSKFSIIFFDKNDKYVDIL